MDSEDEPSTEKLDKSQAHQSMEEASFHIKMEEVRFPQYSLVPSTE